MNTTISPVQAYEWLKDGEAILIDVREPDEFQAEHIAYAASVPLSALPQNFTKISLPQDRKVIIHCLRGGRGGKACAFLNAQNIGLPVYNLDGGMESWKAAGLPVVAGGPRISIIRQIQMIIGSLIFFLVALGLAGMSLGFILAGMVAGALAFAGFTGWCGLAMLLQKMPWNKPHA
ncbi:MAG: rhodanese-like domain-containing protein [Alphaproteobacteria bacterium]|nr:rhodanese-like domain-containing protein [Alphaproteobacteria bacterium]